MKKHGFTLAEILITLGIIGVVAALTAPTLINNAANAQIRPTLTKAVSTLEQANLGVINNQELDSLGDISLQDYLNSIVNLMSGAVPEDTDNNGIDDIIHMKGNIDLVFQNSQFNYNPQGGYRGPYIDVIVDIDGANRNDAQGQRIDDVLGADQYQFAIDRSGSVLPYGGRALHQLNPNIGLWNDNNSLFSCNAVGIFGGNGENAPSGIGCAGSAMENPEIIFR